LSISDSYTHARARTHTHTHTHTYTHARARARAQQCNKYYMKKAIFILGKRIPNTNKMMQ